MRIVRWPVLGLLATSLGCASTPEVPPLDRATIRSVESGVTTLAQIEEWFGAPTDVKVDASGVIWRYERRSRELERPGPIRRVVCSSLIDVPLLQLPLLWIRSCAELVRREELELRFSQERVVIALEFDEDVRAAGPGGWTGGRFPAPDPAAPARSSDVSAGAPGARPGAAASPAPRAPRDTD